MKKTIKRAFTKELTLVTIVIFAFLPFAIRDILAKEQNYEITVFILIVVGAFLIFSLVMNYIKGK